MKVLAIVQARCSSSRLPGKVIKELAGKPMIIHELERLSRSKTIDKIVLATSTEASDDPLALVVADAGMTVYRGNLDDVLDRYYQCASEYQPQHVVRITGDCPVIDWRLVDNVINTHIKHGNDYTTLSEYYPDGLDTEVMKFSALEEAWNKSKLLSEREHVTLYLRNHGNDFKLETIPCKENLESMRWTVDEPQDFMFITQVFAELYSANQDFSMEDILLLLRKKTELMDINRGIQRNEGLAKSLANDKMI
ncbi:cytidylyltransferase domain-containing protein [Selenomonas sp. FC4001]|uniref:cytidylyltransferase domain-containing protein n=1 Tax=Selenomonas sp. FC4001 TaxID=1408313 RepID=UPI00056C292A|nr:glycosyltransferase family protein [Selenomonas sp. FC4001]